MCHSTPDEGVGANVLHYTPKEYALTQAHGDLHKVIPLLCDRGIDYAARQLSTEKVNVTYAWVSRWLTRNGYYKVQRWERAIATERGGK